ncbi:MAG: heparan-alpha-glucosaminide N-acetyltransferase domain-containing protein [Eubacteriales bacterium]|nr:heparan-alpha-glucosaminide N-acetyltransferase domain-containing protein [Eubacteriales bacterium]
MQAKERIYALDEIRGFCVFCMVFHHCMFTLGYMFGGEFAAELFLLCMYIEPFFAAAFIMICGISCNLSENNQKRGLKILGGGLVISAVSFIVMPEAPITFGILHLLGTSVLLYIPLRKIIQKIPVGAGMGLCLVLFLLTYNLAYGYIGFGDFSVTLPQSLYRGYLGTPFGFRDLWQDYSDYFPLFPWFFAFLSGAFLGRLAKEGKFPRFMYKSRVPFFSMLGKNAFLVYIAHQPIAFGIYYLISLFGGIPQ